MEITCFFFPEVSNISTHSCWLYHIQQISCFFLLIFFVEVWICLHVCRLLQQLWLFMIDILIQLLLIDIVIDLLIVVLLLFLYHSIVWPKYHSRIFPVQWQGHSSSGSSRRQAWPERQWLSRKFWVIWSGHHRAQRGHWDWAGMAGLEWFSEWPAKMMAFFVGKVDSSWDLDQRI